MSLYFVTNRNKFSNNQYGDAISYPNGDLDFGRIRFSGTDYVIEAYDYDDQIRGSGGTRVFDELYQDMSHEHGTDTLIYIHGFNYTFAESVQRAKKLKDFYAQGGKRLNVILFAWPSDGNGSMRRQYINDREDAEFSKTAMSRGLQFFASYFKKISRPCGRKIFLMAHSMGNYVLRHAVQSIINTPKSGRMLRLFDEVFLLAADEDRDALERDDKMKPLLSMTKRLSIFSYAGDPALKLSDWFHNPDRLGADGPVNMRSLDSKASHYMIQETVFDENRQYRDSWDSHRYDVYFTPVRDTIIELMNNKKLTRTNYIPHQMSFELV